MAKNQKKGTRQAVQDLVAVAFTKDLEQAREYRRLLKENDIGVVIKESKQTPDGPGFALMVPEDFLDEAHVIIESRDAYGDFCEYAFEENDEALSDNAFDEDGF